MSFRQGVGLAQAVKTAIELPVTTATLATDTPSSVSLPAAKTIAHGRIGDTGTVTVDCAADAILTIYIYVPVSSAWRLPGTDSGSYQKTFTSNGHLDFFQGPAGALFFLKASTGTPTIYHNGDPV